MNRLEARLTADLAALDRRLLRRRRMVRTAGPPTVIELEGRRLVNFASNDYLGLAGDSRVARTLAAGTERWGVGAGAAHLLGGHTLAHSEFEAELAAFLGREAALLFSTGYMANLGVTCSLASRGDTIVADRLNHASLIDAALLSRARLVRYPHANTELAAERVRAARGRVMLATDGVFSMDGDIAPLRELAAIATDTESVFMVDDAHGFGVLAEGRGSVAHFRLSTNEAPVLVVTLGKALGVFGAAVVGSRALIEILVNRARSFVYTTALPPAVAEALTTALGLLRDESWRRQRLAAHISQFRDLMANAGLALAESSTPIQPILLGDPARALAVSRALAARGYYVPAVRPPTVPYGTSRLRVSLSAAHEETQVDGLARALVETTKAGA